MRENPNAYSMRYSSDSEHELSVLKRHDLPSHEEIMVKTCDEIERELQMRSHDLAEKSA